MRLACPLLALVLAACGDDSIMPHPPPVVITHPLKAGEEVACVETLVRIGIGTPIIRLFGWARRTFNCELRRK